jgi:hypothetical protein
MMNNPTARQLNFASLHDICRQAGVSYKQNRETGSFWFYKNGNILFVDQNEHNTATLLMVSLDDTAEVELFQALRTALTLDEWIKKYGLRERDNANQ